MSLDYSRIDPQWAWDSFNPDANRPWSLKLASHLFRRAGFGATWDELNSARDQGPASAIRSILQPTASKTEFEQAVRSLTTRAVSGDNGEQLAACWAYRMLNTNDPLLEKLTLFWHGHFATSVSKVAKAGLMSDQNELLRTNARGRFEEMVRAISRDPAMLIYLDSTTNRRIRPNENYARELMELFCLGVGNYTEADIKEVARAFTGWEVLADAFHFNKAQHDTGTKYFLDKAGEFDGDDAVRIVLSRPACSRFIARKLIRFFVFDEPAVPAVLLEPIAAELRQHDFAIGPAVARILSSNIFFSEYSVARKVRSPIELAVGLPRTLGATTSLVRLAQGAADLGQTLYAPPNVKGWDGGRMWINSATLLGRANLVRQVLRADETRYRISGSLEASADRAGAKSADQVLDWLTDLLLAVPLPAEVRSDLASLMVGASDRSRRIADVISAMAATPEFQLA